MSEAIKTAVIVIDMQNDTVHGYGVTIVSDATSSLSTQWHHAAPNVALQNIATVADTDSVGTALRS